MEPIDTKSTAWSNVVDGDGGGRDLQHHADRDLAVGFLLRLQLPVGAADHFPHAMDFLQRRDHREHDAQLATPSDWAKAAARRMARN